MKALLYIRIALLVILLGLAAAFSVAPNLSAAEAGFSRGIGQGVNHSFTQIDQEISKSAAKQIGYTIKYTKWVPKMSNNRVIIYNHGLQSHRQWFFETAGFFLDQGYTVYAFDRIGAGDSSPGLTLYFNPDTDDYADYSTNKDGYRIEKKMGHVRSWHLFVDTLDQMTVIAGKENPTAQITLWGNSYGAKIVSAYLISKPVHPQVNAVIFTTPGLFRNVTSMPLPFKPAKILLWSFLNELHYFPIPMVAKENDRGAHWFTQNPVYYSLIAEDHRATRRVTARFYLETKDMDAYIAANMKKSSQHQEIPRFYLMVKDDAMMDNEKLVSVLNRDSMNYLTKFYRGGDFHKHFLTFTSDKNQVLQDLLTFMNGNYQEIQGVTFHED